MTASQDYADALVAALEAQRIARRAVLRRARPRPAGDLDRARARAAGRRRAAARARDDPRRGRRGRGWSRRWRRSRGPTTPATAPTCTSRSGRATATASTTRRAPTALGEARAFLAGVLEHLPGLCGLTAPSFNSYRRIVPAVLGRARSSAGATTTARRRCACLRCSRGAEEASTNAELKAADATCNPYLALGGLIAAGLDGIERGLEPPEPVEVDPATLAEDERERARHRAPARDPGRGARRARRRRGADRRARRRARRAPTSPSAAPSGRPTPRGTRHSSNRVTSRSTERGRARRPPRARRSCASRRATLDAFRGLFSESHDPRQWPHVATAVTYRRGDHARWRRSSGCEPTEEAVFAHRLATDPREYAARCCGRPTPRCCCSTTASRRPASVAGASWASSRAARRAGAAHRARRRGRRATASRDAGRGARARATASSR